jgi:hypothetical protein
MKKSQNMAVWLREIVLAQHNCRACGAAFLLLANINQIPTCLNPWQTLSLKKVENLKLFIELLRNWSRTNEKKTLVVIMWPLLAMCMWLFTPQ